MRPVVTRLFNLTVLVAVVASCAGEVASPSTAPSPSARSQTASPSSVLSPTPAPSLSPSAKASPARAKPEGQIVFYDDGSVTSHQQLYIVQADGSDMRPLLASEFDDYKPSLSPDGTKVVFGRIFHQYLPDESAQIFVVNVDGSGLKQLDKKCLKPKCIEGLPDGLAWSPDGTRIAFYRLLADAAGNIIGEGLWVMKADGTGAHEVIHHNLASNASDGQAAWSPDGKRLVFIRDAPEGKAIFTASVDGTDVRQVTPWKLNANDPAWSPDGTLIAFQSPADPTEGVEQDIYTIHPDGSGLTDLTGTLGLGGTNHASWSPDGSQIVFAHFPSTNGVSDLFVMNRDGSDIHLLAATPLNENAPAWGPAPAK